MNLQQLAALAALMPDPTHQVEILPAVDGREAVFVDLHPVGVRPFVRYVVKRFTCVREQFLAPVRAGAAMAGQIGEDGKPAPGAEAAFLAAFDPARQASMTVDDGDEADVAFIALSVCPNPRNLAELQQAEAHIARFSSTVFDACLEAARRVTYGDDPSVFFAAVTKRVTGIDTTQSPSAPASA